MATATKAPRENKSAANPLADALNLVLADSYSLMGLTHLAHWNVEGPGFFTLHTAFEEHYRDLFEAVDEIAERIRALDNYAIGGLAKLASTAALEEFSAPMAQEDYVTSLINAHEKLLRDARRARDVAGELQDAESQDLMVRRIQWHEKVLWMLRSFLKS